MNPFLHLVNSQLFLCETADEFDVKVGRGILGISTQLRPSMSNLAEDYV